jgi:uncharacterized membrane protein YkvA (DUF1232 family)
VLDKVDIDFFKRQAQKITDKDIKTAFRRADDIQRTFKNRGSLRSFVGDAPLLIAIVKDYWRGDYREIPYFTLSAIVFALLYVLNPLDIMPDAVPIAGQIDDAAIMSVCLLLVEQDLRKYERWQVSTQVSEN